MLTIALAWVGCGQEALAAQTANPRTALVIVNTAYLDDDKPASIPSAEVQAFGKMLTADGYKVDVVENASKDAMRAMLDRFVQNAASGGTALVFFSGYGIQADAKNYLIPVDAQIWKQEDVLRDGASVDAILDGLAKRGTAIRAVILDAARRNPFERRYRSYSFGLSAMKDMPGTVVLSSAPPGNVLSDEAAGQSRFVAALTRELALPDQTLEQAFAKVRETLRESAGKQVEKPSAPGPVSAGPASPSVGRIIIDLGRDQRVIIENGADPETISKVLDVLGRR